MPDGHLLLARYEPLKTDSALSVLVFMKKKNRKNRLEIARKIISDIKREMQKPRLTESVRNDVRYQAAPVVKEPSARSARV